MKRMDHLLWIVAEEGMETGQRASKAARFGLDEIQPGQPLTNYQRMVLEFADKTAAMRMVAAEHGKVFPPPDFEDMVHAKIEKVEKFLAYSAECGTLESATPVDSVEEEE